MSEVGVTTQKITFSKKTVRVKSISDDLEYPKATKKDGRYIVPWELEEQPSHHQHPGRTASFKNFLKLDESRIPNQNDLNEEPLMEVTTADPERLKEPPEDGIRTTWLGHASVLFQLDNVNILVNPNFCQSGIKIFNFAISNRRYRPPVYSVDDLPRIDCVFITNSRFDYLDLPSIRLLNAKFNDMILWYVPMGLGEYITQQCGCINIVEMDWWKEDEVDFIDHGQLEDNHENEETKTTTFKITCTPSQSVHIRALDGCNAPVLWCSWVVASPRYKLFLAGATGYDSKLFKSIGRRYGPFHMSALPIGSYGPTWKLGLSNVTPEQSVQIHQDLLSMCSFGTSWGTFTVSNEHYLEPPKLLKEELSKQGLSELQFFILKHGESRLVDIVKLANGHHHHEEHTINGDVHHHHHEGHHTEINGEVHHHEHDEQHGDVHHHEHVEVHTEVHHHHHDHDEEKQEETTEVTHTHDGVVEITTVETINTENGETVTVSKHVEVSADGLSQDDVAALVADAQESVDGHLHIEKAGSDEEHVEVTTLESVHTSEGDTVTVTGHTEISLHGDIENVISHTGGFGGGFTIQASLGDDE